MDVSKVEFEDYSGSFTIWNFTKAQIPARATILIATLLRASLTVFIFFEVYKMTINAIHFRRVSQVLVTATSSIDFLSKYKAVEIEAHRASFTGYAVWVICLAFCVVTAIAALALLFYNFFAFLVGLTLWPA